MRAHIRDLLSAPDDREDGGNVTAQPGPITWLCHGAGTEHASRTLTEGWMLDNEQLEAVHDYIQWLFPTPGQTARSRIGPGSSAISSWSHRC